MPEAYALLSKFITSWETTHQCGDETVGLYRVRGDVDMVSFVLLNYCWYDYFAVSTPKNEANIGYFNVIKL